MANYIRQHAQWSIFFQEHSLCDDIPKWLEAWRGDGIIARLDNEAMVSMIQRRRVPVVYLRHVVPTPKRLTSSRTIPPCRIWRLNI